MEKLCNVCSNNKATIGLRCKPCHLAIRRKKERAKYRQNPEPIRARHRRNYHARNAKYRAAKRKAYSALPPDVRQQRSKACRQNFKQKCKNIPGYRTAFNAWQRAYRNLRLPKWVKLEDFLETYAKSDELGDNYVVDHEIPLRGEKVSGLHVPQNLQIITRTENLEKGNKYEPK